jgi:tRNA A-37 threonylcarbamoyl transferase component Bud32
MSDRAPGPREGSRLGPYVLKRMIGRGRMGEVYEADNNGRLVALKLFREDLSRDPTFNERLRRTAHEVSRLRNPHIVPIHGYGDFDGVLCVGMELIAGVNLRRAVANDGPLPAARAVAIIRQVASALDAAHEHGITHGDLKPENVLVTRDESVYVTDFGFAKPLTPSDTVDQLACAAPERMRGEPATSRADIYALACMLYECLTARAPYPADDAVAEMNAHLTAPVPRPSDLARGIPKAFDDVVARGMAKDPDARYSSAGDLATAADEALKAGTASSSVPRERALPFHDDVQFTVYRPRLVRPYQWATLLAFAHLGEAPLGADPQDDPIRQVQQRARGVLGDRIESYSQVTQDSSVGLPEEAEITFALDLPDFEIKVPTRTFLWVNAVQMEEFQIRAVVDLQGGTARGRLRIMHGSILLAEVRLAMRVDSAAPEQVSLKEAPASAAPFRKIFPSYSHRDAPIVVQFEQYMEAIGDRYLRDVHVLRAGEVWTERLSDCIREADVFQLFWSHNAMGSRFVEHEWRYALSLNRPEFIRPTYWEQPMPSGPGLPPPDLGRLHFHPLGAAAAARRSATPPPIPAFPPPPPPQAPPPPPSGSIQRKANRWIPLTAVASVLAVIVGGLAIWGTSKPSISGNTAKTSSVYVEPPETVTDTRTGDPTRASETRTPTAVPTTETSSPPSSPTDTPTSNAGSADTRLRSLLPAGYDSGACTAVSPAGGALATVNCSKNSLSGGPNAAQYSLFADGGALSRQFSNSAGSVTGASPCAQSPTSWSGGQVACGTTGGDARIVWTRSGDLLLGDARGSDLAGLHSWWLSNR